MSFFSVHGFLRPDQRKKESGVVFKRIFMPPVYKGDEPIDAHDLFGPKYPYVAPIRPAFVKPPSGEHRFSKQELEHAAQWRKRVANGCPHPEVGVYRQRECGGNYERCVKLIALMIRTRKATR